MKKIILLFTLVFGLNIASAQVDVIKKQIGETLKGRIISVDDNVIVFTYEGQNVPYTIAKNAVEKITYGRTGQVVQTSNKIAINDQADWEKVVILDNLDKTLGLEVGQHIGSSADLANYQSGSRGSLAVERRLKTEAARLGYQFVLVTTDASSNTTAVVYKY
ncbi:hypothetical protein [Flavobacterium sangjuense]|uniref:Uncharacterized protein n=1 Tax=Flavobacterium sangjuense TaxID=2518177 RepID=A0A4P7PRN3_9FLAO|nr:hypothetical protein [Flavobacterium sangjuense]QBZ97551.1 hypothetical protein GS03_01043 [Flavobacterium sangjuense]